MSKSSLSVRIVGFLNKIAPAVEILLIFLFLLGVGALVVLFLVAVGG